MEIYNIPEKCIRYNMKNPRNLGINARRHQTLEELGVWNDQEKELEIDCTGAIHLRSINISGNTRLLCSGCYSLNFLYIMTGLQELDCSGTYLTSLILPSSLIKLTCRNCVFLEVLNLPENLEILDCGGCPLTKLDLPPRISTLCCQHTKITELSLPESLHTLFCGYTLGLKNLILTSCVKSLDCSYSGITELEFFGKKLICNYAFSLRKLTVRESCEKINCYGCDNLTEIFCSNIKYLNCSSCKNLKTLKVDEYETILCTRNRKLTEVVLNSTGIYDDSEIIYDGSPWFPLSEDYEEKLKKLEILQRFCGSLRIRKLLRLSKTRKFCEWFYHPENYGGRWAKNSLRKLF